MPIENTKDIARYFQVLSIQVRPDAAKVLLEQTLIIKYSEHRQRYLDKFVALLKDWQKASRQPTNIVLDLETTTTICSSAQLVEFDPAISKTRSSIAMVHNNFKAMKQDAKIKTQVAKQSEDQVMVEESPFVDKIVSELNRAVVSIVSLNEFPKTQLINKQVLFHPDDGQRSIFEIHESRFDFFQLRLALVEDRVFSHTQLFDRPKLFENKQNSQIETVYNLHSMMGKKNRLSVLGILTQKEDLHYYLEDQTASIKISFAELEYADPDAYFTESCVLLCEGIHQNDTFMVTSIEHPPLHHNKSLRFKLSDQDYFGAYNKVRVKHMLEHVHKPLIFEQAPSDQSFVIINQIEIDQPKQLKAFEQLLIGLDSMQPRVIVCIGRLFSERAAEAESTDQFIQYIEVIVHIVKEKKLDKLREHTEWIFMPALDDPGQIKIFPCMPFGDYLFAPMEQAKFKKVTLAPNPLRINFLGKEIVICRYNFLKKIKQNHIPRIEAMQQKYLKTETGHKIQDDAYKVAKTILRQGYLLPLPQIVQPVMWSYAMDCMNLTPEPDFLVLADECQDYYYQLPISEATQDGMAEQKTCHVLNPGNFSMDQSFVVIYPFSATIEPSKIGL